MRDGSNDADSRKGVPFGVSIRLFVDIAAHIGVKSPPKPNFGGVNRHFHAKLAK